MLIGKYLSGLRKLDHVIAFKAGFEAQLRASCLAIPFGMRALSMTRQIRDGRLGSVSKVEMAMFTLPVQRHSG